MGFGFFQGDKIKLLKSKLNLNNSATIRGDLINTNTVVVADGSKDIKSSTVTTTELGYLSGATGDIQDQLNNKIGNDPLVSLTGDLAVTGSISTEDGVEFIDSTYTIRLQPPTLSGNSTYTLPATTPVANGYVLSSTTAGTMSWVQQSGGGATGDISNTNFAVSASTTNSIVTFDSSLQSAHIFWSLHNVDNNAHQAGNSIAVHKNASWELISTIAGTATFGGVNLTITSGGVLQLDNPSVTGTFIYRVLAT